MDLNSFKVSGDVLNKYNTGKLVEKRKQVIKSLYQFSILLLSYSMFRKQNEFEFFIIGPSEFRAIGPKTNLVGFVFYRALS